jgi:hypothetical protein
MDSAFALWFFKDLIDNVLYKLYQNFQHNINFEFPLLNQIQFSKIWSFL